MESDYRLQDGYVPEQRQLPNAIAVLVLGILSIVFCFFCGIVALVMSAQDVRLYKENPELYSKSSYDLLNAGRICSIVSLCMWALAILFFITILILSLSFATLNW
jgi:hypothetical protein